MSKSYGMCPLPGVTAYVGAVSLLVAVVMFGCRSVSSEHAGAPTAVPYRSTSIDAQPPQPEPLPQILPAEHLEPIGPADSVASQIPTESVVAPTAAEAEVIHPGEFVDEVLRVNPSVAVAVANWRAVAQRYPQVVSLDDPMLSLMLAPASIGSDQVNTGYTIKASQKIPWPGKRELRGAVASAEARAAEQEIGEVRLRLAEAAEQAYLDYYIAHRNLELNTENRQLATEFRQAAQTRYEQNRVQQTDLLLAQVELGEAERQALQLGREERVARARINTLLARPADAHLFPPEQSLPDFMQLPPVTELRALAAAQRPELAAQAARIRAERDQVALACREFYPDLTFTAGYDAFWQEEPLRPVIGLDVNIPLHNKRYAAVREMSARVAEQQAQYQEKLQELDYDVQSTYEQVVESRQAAELYSSTILPPAEQGVQSLRAAYVTGTVDLLRLVEAQRQLVMLREKRLMATVEYHRRLAQLERAVGGSLPSTTPPTN